jgi:hypothetical protein
MPRMGNATRRTKRKRISMRPHIYKVSASDIRLPNAISSAVLAVLPEETLVSEDVAITLYQYKNKEKPKEFPYLSKASIVNQLKDLERAKFIKTFSGYEIRNLLKLAK